MPPQAAASKTGPPCPAMGSRIERVVGGKRQVSEQFANWNSGKELAELLAFFSLGKATSKLRAGGLEQCVVR